MTARRVTALVIIGCPLVLPGLGLLLSGSGLALTYGLGRDSAGYVTSSTAEVVSAASVVITRDVGVVLDAGTPEWVLRRLDADLRLRVDSGASSDGLFVGVGPADDVAAYLLGTAQDEVIGSEGRTLTYQHLDGASQPTSPAAQSFWLASANGPGPLTLDWTATRGDWVLVLMNSDGSPGVSADVTVGAKAGFLVPLANAALWLGVTLLGAAAALVLLAVRHARPRGTEGVGVGPGTAARALMCPQPPATSLPTVATAVADVEPEPAEVSS